MLVGGGTCQMAFIHWFRAEHFVWAFICTFNLHFMRFSIHFLLILLFIFYIFSHIPIQFMNDFVVTPNSTIKPSAKRHFGFKYWAMHRLQLIPFSSSGKFNAENRILHSETFSSPNESFI